MHNLAATRHDLGDLDGARQLHEQALPAAGGYSAMITPTPAEVRRRLGEL
jgi:hypothetical protein